MRDAAIDYAKLSSRFSTVDIRSYAKNLWTIALLGALFVYLFLQGPDIQRDSISYLKFEPIRSMGYPLFLKAYQWLWGENFESLVALQLLMGFGTSIWLSNKMCQIFGSSKIFIKTIVTVIFLIPYLGYTHIGNVIMSEALCYPLFLGWVGSFIGFIQKENKRSFGWSVVWMTLLILTRRQFLFLYPVMGVVLFYWLIKKQSIKKNLTYLMMLLVTFAFTNGIERLYQYQLDGHFKTVPFTGFSGVVLPLFISSPEDGNLFSDARQKALFDAIRPKMEDKGLVYTHDQQPMEVFVTPLNRFMGCYDLIAWYLMHSTLKKMGFDDLYENEQWLTEMAVILVRQHFPQFLNIYVKNIVINMGGYYFVLLLGIIFAILSYRLLCSNTTQNKRDQICFFLMCTHFANYMLIALVQMAMKRYTLYTDPLQIVLLFLLLMTALMNQNKENESNDTR